MLNLLWLIPAIPFLGFLLLAIFGGRINRSSVAWIGVGSVALPAILSILIGINFISSPPPNNRFDQTLWIWMSTSGFNPGIAFHLDGLSLIFIFAITFVGFLIHLYSAEFMKDDEGYSRFFAYMNLFIGSMVTLVLADNLLLLYLGWEGVGLCSYLLIGFWYKEPENVYAANKAFIVTRIGDTAMAIGLFLLVKHFNTLNIQDILQLASANWTVGSSLAVLIAFLLLGGALGKSAQLPLQTWLPDAMAGPSPVSALIHAATMVTAGVYLIARTHTLFELAPVAQSAVAIIGALTLSIAGFSALTQTDIKRVLAYSTISQIGYMFLALGIGAWAAGIFHFMIHAFFKSLLFLAAGVVINALHHEHNMFKMGGLRKKLPVTYWTFLIASASLAALPLITAGFYSKDAIIWYTWSSDKGSPWLWLIAIIGAFITSIYTFRMVFVTFFGEQKTHVSHKPGNRIKITLIVLAVLSILGGFIEMPETLGGFAPFSSLLKSVLPVVTLKMEGDGMELLFQILTALLAIAGVFLAYQFYLKNSKATERFKETAISQFLFNGWGFDWLYDRIFVSPAIFFARIDKNDFIDKVYSFIAWLSIVLNKIFVVSQNGQLRRYAMAIVIGAVIIFTIVVAI
ncbi:MAG: NADH-quinone oxidoreductase subunit L [Candidatus Kuenenia stuttgartiensis]|nr:NADH-quinone oxidoreductase subunit L [Candidatus Kuenenia stuttgartiensis]